MACACVTGPVSGNDTSFIPIKIGEPLSTACERATTVGSIPQVIRYANFTLVGGTTVENKISNAGISNMASFFTSREGCYYDKNGQLSGSTCA